MANRTRTAGMVALVIVTAIRGLLGFALGGLLLVFGSAAGGSLGGAVAIVGLIAAALSFLLLFVAAGLWMGRWFGWVLGVVVFGLNSLLGLYQFQATGLSGIETIVLVIDVVGLAYLVVIRDRFGSGGGNDRSVPETPHRR